MRALEDVLWVSLFQRYRDGVRVTAADAHFFEQARNILAQFDFANQQFSFWLVVDTRSVLIMLSVDIAGTEMRSMCVKPDSATASPGIWRAATQLAVNGTAKMRTSIYEYA